MAIIQDLWQIVTGRVLPSTAAADSLGHAIRTLSIAAAAGNPAASSALDRLLRQLALSSGDAADSLSKVVYDNTRYMRSAALTGTETAGSLGKIARKFQDEALAGTELADSAFRVLRQLFLEATAAAPVANSGLDRIKSTPKLVDAALDGTEVSNSIGRAVRQMFLEASAAAPVTNSALDRIKGTAGFLGYTTAVPVVRPSRANGLSLMGGANWSTPGAYSEFVAANNITTDYIVVGFGASVITAVASDLEVDIATGAGGSETVKGTYAVSATASHKIAVFTPIYPPIKITANTRMAARVVAAGSSDGLDNGKFVIFPLPL